MSEDASALKAATQPEKDATQVSAAAATEVKAKSTGEKATTASEQREDGESDDGEEDTVLLSEVLRHDEIMSETANAVLGDCSNTNCSYPMGYMRQAVYACLTCTPDVEAKPETRAGICLACSYNCHEGHNLVELYTKRAFRCDCGNSKFPSDNPCKLDADKAPVNERNAYSQNFWGKYCTCHRPYPDPERTTEEVMVQCVICEDWLHDEHILPAATASATAEVAEEEDSGVPEHFDELVCLECMQKHPFLMAYTLDEEDEEAEGNETSTDDATATASSSPAPATEPTVCTLKPRLRELMKQATNASSEGEDVSPESVPVSLARPTFWPFEWRESICQCSSCIRLLERRGIAFLVDADDSLYAYESNAKARAAENEERAADALTQSLSHEQKVEMGMAYHHMKSNLQQFLGGFAASGKTLRTEDVQSFFYGLKQSYKRQKTGEE